MSTVRVRRRQAQSVDAQSVGARGDILHTAVRLFATRGYHATSVQDLADALGYGKASLYHYVRSKDDILLAIHELFMRRLIDDATAVVREDARAADKLRRIIVNFVDLVGQHRAEATVVNEEMRELSPRSLKRVVAKRDEYERMLTELVEQAKAAGELDVADERIAARAILGMVNWCYRWLRANGPHSPREVGEQMASLVLHDVPDRAVDAAAK